MQPQIVVHKDDLEICHFQGLRQDFPTHFHEHYVLGCLTAGRRALKCSGSGHLLDASTLVMINGGQPHSCQGNGMPEEWLCMHIPLALIRDLSPSGPAAPRFLNIYRDESLVRDFRQALGPSQPHREKLRSLLAKLYRISSPSWTRRPSDSLANMVNDLRSKPQLAYSLDRLASSAGLGKFDFLRKFTDFTGMTPWRYLIQLRLSLARRLIHSGFSLPEVAMDAGFYDQAHLGKYFRKHLGFTPAAYRNAVARAAKGL